MGGGGKKAPKMEVPEAPEIPESPKESDKAIKQAGDNERRRRLAAQANNETVLTSGLGDTSSMNLKRKTLLGE